MLSFGWVALGCAVLAVFVTALILRFGSSAPGGILDDLPIHDFTSLIGLYLAVLFMSLCLGGTAYGIYAIATGHEEQAGRQEGTTPDQQDCFPQAPASC